MNDVYGRVSPGRLLRRERDPLTGHLTARREDKRRDEDSSQHHDGSQGLLGHGARFWAAAGVGAAVVVASVVGALALGGVVGGDGDPESRAGGGRDGRPGSSAGPSGTGPSGLAPSLPPPSVPAASAISLDYAGGRLTKEVCTSSTPGYVCTADDYTDFGFDPLPVRCTPDGCTVYFFGGVTAPLDGPVSLDGSYDDDPCPAVFWTLRLTPEGSAVTEGIAHPARLTGVATVRRATKDIPTADCLGADDEYRYDASP